MALKEAELDTILSSLSLLTSGAVALKQLDLAELHAEKSRQHAEDQLLLQHSLQLHGQAVARKNQITDELKQLGIPYDKVTDEKSRALIESIGKNEINNLNKITNKTKQLDDLTNDLSSNITAYNKGQSLSMSADIDQSMDLSPDEINAYIKANPDLASQYNIPALESGMQVPFKKEALTMEGMEQEIAAYGDKKKLTDQQIKTSNDQSALISLQVKGAKMEMLKELRLGGNITLTGIVPESTDAALIAAEGKGGYEGYAVSQEWSNVDLVSIANNANIDYKDELSGIADYSDMNAWMEHAKVEAKDFARNNSGMAWLGVSQDDINNNSEAYQIFESKYLKAAEHGILNNVSYDKAYRSKGSVDQAKAVESQTLRVTNPEDYATLANASAQVSRYFGVADADGNIELNIEKKEIKTFLTQLGQKGSKKNVNKVKNTMLAIMQSTDPEFIRKQIMEDKNVQALISITSIGKKYMQYIMEVSARLDSQKSLRSSEFKGMTNNTMNEMDKILQNNIDRNR